MNHNSIQNKHKKYENNEYVLKIMTKRCFSSTNNENIKGNTKIKKNYTTPFSILKIKKGTINKYNFTKLKTAQQIENTFKL